MKNHRALVAQTRVRAVNTAPATAGSAHFGMRLDSTTSTFAVNAPKKKHPKIPWSSIRMIKSLV